MTATQQASPQARHEQDSSRNGAPLIWSEQNLRRYRGMLDEEDQAFDGLEHAVEDGDHDKYQKAVEAWHHAVRARVQWLAGWGLC